MLANPLAGLPGAEDCIAQPPWRPSGVVVGALLNDRAELQALGEAAAQAPYKGLPQAPVLQVRPRNTLALDGARVAVPGEVEVGATLGLVIGRVACNVGVGEALTCVGGCTVVADLRLPHGSHYRPALRQRARDGFCIVGPRIVARPADLDALAVTVAIDGATAQRGDTGGRVRGAAQLVADVSRFMTLRPGDLLLLGAAHGAPRAHAGQAVAVTIEGIGTLRFTLEAER